MAQGSPLLSAAPLLVSTHPAGGDGEGEGGGGEGEGGGGEGEGDGGEGGGDEGGGEGEGEGGGRGGDSGGKGGGTRGGAAGGSNWVVVIRMSSIRCTALVRPVRAPMVMRHVGSIVKLESIETLSWSVMPAATTVIARPSRVNETSTQRPVSEFICNQLRGMLLRAVAAGAPKR